MSRIIFASLAFTSLVFASQASAVTLDSGEILITQNAAVAGNVTPGDAPGFPVTLSIAGQTYRLASTLTLSAPLNGIEVTAPEVTIDFAGFRLTGSGAGVIGVLGKARSLSVIGGTIRGFTSRGISMQGQQLRVEGMRIADNGSDGIAESNPNDPALIGYARITNSTITGNNNGIYCGPYCHIEGNNIVKNRAYGAVLNSGGLVLGNTIASNTQFGVVSGNTNVGIGNNAIVNNPGGSVTGSFTPLQPNACVPACP